MSYPFHTFNPTRQQLSQHSSSLAGITTEVAYWIIILVFVFGLYIAWRVHCSLKHEKATRIFSEKKPEIIEKSEAEKKREKKELHDKKWLERREKKKRKSKNS